MISVEKYESVGHGLSHKSQTNPEFTPMTTVDGSQLPYYTQSYFRNRNLI